MIQATLVDGKKIADTILSSLKEEVKRLKKAGTTPTLAVIFIGDNPASRSYIKQKQNAGEAIGAKVELIELPMTVTDKELKTVIQQYNSKAIYHGIIIQRPLPKEVQIDPKTLLSIDLSKEIDGFVPDSPFEPPVARAVITILENMYYDHFDTDKLDFVSWMRPKNIVVVGKGETAGRPIALSLEKLSLPVIVIDRKTPEPESILRKADIIISCVGRQRYITSHKIKQGVFVISVGITRGDDGKLHGDYEDEEIQEKAIFYTSTPGGVGPVNVACLMQNLIKAAKEQYTGGK